MIFINEDIHKDKSGIYQIRNTLNQKVYIGQTTVCFIKRFWHHKWKLTDGTHDNKHLQAAWDKYGEQAFVFEVVHILQNNEDIDSLEINYIRDFKATKCDFGYNILPGGQEKNLVQYVPSDSYKIVGMKNREHMLGTKLSDETRQHMRESAHRGENNCSAKLTNEDVVEIKKMLKNGYSANSISKQFSVSKQNILSIKHNKTWTHITI